MLDTLVYLKNETDVWLEITNLLIPGENDSEEEVESMCRWIRKNLGPEVPVHFSAFHPDFKMLNKSKTPLETILKACEIARASGIHYVYAGNVHNQENDTTYCHECDESLIGRDWYVLKDWNIDSGRCPKCQTVCAGRFEKSPGTWGSRRQMVQIT